MACEVAPQPVHSPADPLARGFFTHAQRIAHRAKVFPLEVTKQYRVAVFGGEAAHRFVEDQTELVPVWLGPTRGFLHSDSLPFTADSATLGSHHLCGRVARGLIQPTHEYGLSRQ